MKKHIQSVLLRILAKHFNFNTYRLDYGGGSYTTVYTSAPIINGQISVTEVR